MVTPLTPSTVPTALPGDIGRSRLDSLQTNGAKSPTVTTRAGQSSSLGVGVEGLNRIAQNVATGGSAYGKGNIRFTSGPGGRVGTTAAHVLDHQNPSLPVKIPTRINVGGEEARTSIKEFFPDPTAVKIYNVADNGGQRLDVIKLGRPADIRAHFEKLAVAQPSANTMKTALSAPTATWQVSAASRPQSYDSDASRIEPLTSQTNGSETTPKFSFQLTALPLQVKDLSADLKASGLGAFANKPDSWLALGGIGGDENNRALPYKNLYLVNRGVSGSEAKASGISAEDNGTLIASADVRDVESGWTLGNVRTLVERSAPLRSALKVKFPALTTSQAAEKLYRQGMVKIAFITKELAVSNLKAIDSTAR